MDGLRLEAVRWQVRGKEILKGVSFSLERGGILSVIGPSGSGKTSLLRIIAGLVRDYTGSVFLSGRTVDKLPPEKRGAVLVRQSGNLLPHLTVRENIGFGLKMRRVPKREIRDTVDSLLAMVHLEEQADSFPGKISAGQSQRAALARALAVRPFLILLDEPFANLDPRLRLELRSCVMEAVRKTGASMIMVTHEWEDAFYAGNEVAALFEGSFFPLDRYGQPLRPDTAVQNYLSGCRIVHGLVADGIFTGEGFSVPCAARSGPARAFITHNGIKILC
jgi:ABC-type sugar transport system ATPase subunit